MRVIFIALVVVLGFLAFSIESRNFDVNVNPIRDPQEKRDEFLTKQKNESFENRIGNGFPAVEGQFPWQAWMEFFYINGPAKNGAGTLITPTWVVTGVYYLYYNATGVHLYFGSVDRNNFPEVRFALKYVIHPLYEQKYINYQIALVQLNAAVPFRPVNLPTRSSTSQSYEGVNMLMAGFGGNTWGGPPSQFLMYTVAIGEPWSTCGYSSYNLLCARPIGNSFTEYGDIGGPLLHGSDTLVGINHYVSPYSQDQKDVLFARVDQFLDWIASHTGVEIH